MRSERLRFEPLSVEHAEALVAALDDARVGRFIGGPDVTSVEATRTRIERVNEGPPDRPTERWINFAVVLEVDREQPIVIGRIEATTYDGEWAEIAYLLGPRWWGHGYATEATSWLADHLREARGIGELWAAIHPDNAASIHLVERLGFIRTDVPTRELGSFDHGDLVYVRARA